MAKELKLRRGTTTEHSTFTGAEGEITVDTTKDTVVVHDGATAGGVPLAKEADIPTGALAAKDTVATADIDADAIDGTKIADNAIDSEHYVDGSIDSIHLAADVIDGTKIADDAIDSEHIAADSIDSEHYAPGSVDATALATNAVTNAKVADDAIGIAELSATGSPSSSTYLRGDNTWATISTGGVTYLGQATLSGNSTSISGLSLSGYKFLAVTVYNAGVNAGNNQVYLTANNSNSNQLGFAHEYNTGLASNAGINGSVFVDLATGAFSPPNSDEPTMAYIPSGSRILNSTTTIYLRWSSTASFTSGTMRVYGIS